MIILSIETSCDETAVSIVKINKNRIEVLSDVVSSQIKMHSFYGGVVPQLAARAHLKNMIPVLRKSFKKAGIEKRKVDYIAFTKGPGLIPALMIGNNAAKALSFALNKPLVEVNHLEGHIYANWLGDKIGNSYLFKKNEFPVLCLIVSGGHTQLVLMKDNMKFKIIGETVDDAVGEAFDKVAKILDLGYPGGPIIEQLAKSGNPERFSFPRPMISSGDFNFSFSGLKTAVLYEKQKFKKLSEKDKCDFAASFQKAATDVLVAKTIKAADKYKVKNIFLGGGVSANKFLRSQIKKSAKENLGLSTSFPPFKFTTDNALMIAVAAYYHIKEKKNIIEWKKVKPDMNLRLK